MKKRGGERAISTMKKRGRVGEWERGRVGEFNSENLGKVKGIERSRSAWPI